MTGRPAPRRLAGLTLVVCLLASCAGARSVPRAVLSPGLIRGWQSISYGAITVGLPQGWRMVSTLSVPPCQSPPPRTIVVGSYDHLTGSSCPAMRRAPALSFIRLVCLTGRAVSVYSPAEPTTIVRPPAQRCSISVAEVPSVSPRKRYRQHPGGGTNSSPGPSPP